jgi:hypothetical protein
VLVKQPRGVRGKVAVDRGVVDVAVVMGDLVVFGLVVVAS